MEESPENGKESSHSGTPMEWNEWNCVISYTSVHGSFKYFIKVAPWNKVTCKITSHLLSTNTNVKTIFSFTTFLLAVHLHFNSRRVISVEPPHATATCSSGSGPRYRWCRSFPLKKKSSITYVFIVLFNIPLLTTEITVHCVPESRSRPTPCTHSRGKTCI